ncbi:HAD family hydrolase [Streptomyces noursei]|uniref:HAD family hydrolase n=1 Tax=Streptomyces noursei TaxID=1971 RepID=UPI00167949DB|nr:HAD family hydrolase [Streptomyces noursei]MCZ1014869.1 HAD family hydrolase [Streptomyces noursei]GGX53315.1 haloacid dehalogenase [Streptomyces noursei]
MLIFDADDTLWENNVIFERVIDEFTAWMAGPGTDRAAVRAVLDKIEAANTRTLGYGSKMFLRSLGECVERLRGRAATAAERARIAGWEAAFAGDRVELIPGVAETLAELAGRHELLLLTKGDREEQQRKVTASGLTGHFRGVHIVPEKNVAAYEELTRGYGLAPERTWMIGNSPKSDILPARSAGLNAVFIPHDHTWVLEHEELDPGDEKVLRLGAFRELVRHF